MKTTMRLKKAVNEKYNNVNIIDGVPSGLKHIPYTRDLIKLEIPYVKALIGFNKNYNNSPIISGVVIDERHFDKLEKFQTSKKENIIKKSQSTIEKITKQLNDLMVAQALYVVNKYAKELTNNKQKCKMLYRIKESVLSYYNPICYHQNKFIGENREYILRRNYGEDDVDEYYLDLQKCTEDESGRPYISHGDQQQERWYEYYEIAGFGFHTPIENLQNINLPIQQIGDGYVFVAPRGIDLAKLGKRISLKRALLILDIFLKSKQTN